MSGFGDKGLNTNGTGDTNVQQRKSRRLSGVGA
jgi:hypothetical protein